MLLWLLQQKQAKRWLFGVDTVKSDEIIPSFYIAHAGHYLYYAEDSVNTLNGEDKYKLEGGDVKLIFKAAELVSSDTLKTVVEGKEVLVAEKANRLQKVAGGLNNFQFQIIKDEEGSDEYVIRKTGTYQYVREINGLLALTNTKKLQLASISNLSLLRQQRRHRNIWSESDRWRR